ncbi:TPA: hypothetical protein N0F65_001263 [Lagenidium giganteum]|uniref:Uncharacterized protein n=1 Tax=Lagenidium giganteum TaxID=4803 RepID=A0AAV2YWX7_9STRA|nr:TPA: hypothetical protein N0F65_001263 [Lagenidium giganteum]
MTKAEFKQKLNDYFVDDLKHLEEEAAQAQAEADALTQKIQALDDCIEQAANKFGWYGVYEQAPHFQNAVDWVANDCLAH